MNLIKKISVLGLCFTITFNPIANADILDSILDIEPAETTTPGAISTNIVSLSDINEHWAENWIKEAIEMGFVKGYEDKTFKPDRTVTRAEFATLLNNAIKNNDTVSLNLSDLSEDDWYYKEIEKAVAVGFFGGYENNTFRPNNPITREEAAKVVSSAITTGDLDGDGANLLKDYSAIQDWAKPSVQSAYNKGYIIGYPEGLYKPTKAVTRAEAVKIIYEIIKNENIERGFNLTNSNETYYGAVVVGDLNVLDSVGTGSVYINNVTVLGDIVVSAENLNSIDMTDVKARSIIVKDKNNTLKIICHDNINIKNSQLPSKVIIQKLGNNITIGNQ
ncbi:S-layer homology domain-containing protein [Sedimentibacter sp. MB31-C6]|uniref:S-layer homology domain-containing protein n=1 Tax=Sedimentibacter sp. MB31-C6 TaxID=3109366 RepID=UPI002DDCD8BB|nr:S-layer homology domain-containing protein [Sedimentibacter sp. MB36-C1]WSI05505.1 S-layer homology domain-containing protein [Sedimentibacter sp. MB36-C1]